MGHFVCSSKGIYFNLKASCPAFKLGFAAKVSQKFGIHSWRAKPYKHHLCIKVIDKIHPHRWGLRIKLILEDTHHDLTELDKQVPQLKTNHSKYWKSTQYNWNFFALCIISPTYLHSSFGQWHIHHCFEFLVLKRHLLKSFLWIWLVKF